MATAMPDRTPHFHGFDTVVGYSDLGHIFLANRRTGEHAVLHPFKFAVKSYGVFADTAAFVDEVLREPVFAQYVLQPDHVAAIRDLEGPLGTDQVYIPVPYPILGGTEEPETYKAGDVWVFLDLVGQVLGAGASRTKRRWWSRRG